MLCVSFTWQMVKTLVIRSRLIEGPNARDKIVFCAFHFGSPNENYILTEHA